MRCESVVMKKHHLTLHLQQGLDRGVGLSSEEPTWRPLGRSQPSRVTSIQPSSELWTWSSRPHPAAPVSGSQ